MISIYVSSLLFVRVPGVFTSIPESVGTLINRLPGREITRACQSIVHVGKHLTSMKLRQVIADTALPLGATEAGKVWCTKALHPADVAIPVSIPDRQARPHAGLCFGGQYKISPPGGLNSTDSWDADLLLSPDMICPGSYTVDKTGNYLEPLMDRLHLPSGLANRFLNSQIIGTGATPEESYQLKLATVQQNVREARLSYFGATLELQAPSLSDQGTVVAAQYDLPYDMFNFAGVDNVNKKVLATKPLAVTRLQSMPSFSSMMSIPGSYTGKVKDGVYAPLKLSEEALHFVNVQSSVAPHTDWDQATGNFVSDLVTITSTTGLTGPIACCRDYTLSATDGTGTTQRDEALPRLTNRIIHICARGMSPNATLYITIRHGYEVTVAPNSIYSPYVTLPPPPDYAAVEAYFAIARQLADAYPGDYNSLGTLLPIIANIAAETLPKVLPAFKDIWSHLKTAFTSYKTQVHEKKK